MFMGTNLPSTALQNQRRPWAVSKGFTKLETVGAIKAQNEVLLIAQQAGEHGNPARGEGCREGRRQPGQRRGQDVGTNQIEWRQIGGSRMDKPVGDGGADKWRHLIDARVLSRDLQ